jgi:hypothetical protein
LAGPPATSKGAAARGGKTKGAGAKDKKPDTKEAIGVDDDGPPPAVSTPAAAPPPSRWVPIPGKYGNPLTSGLVPPTAPGRNQFHLALD